MIRLLERLLRRPAGDETLWQKCAPTLWPRRLVNGEVSIPQGGQLWRRRTENGWEYQQDEETQDEYDARQL